MPIEHHFTVYGDAELCEGGTRVWPKQVLVRKGVEQRSAWLVLEGLDFTGVCVVGCIQTGKKLRYDRVSWDPNPEPPGQWQSFSTTGGVARWIRVRRKTAWEHVLRA